MLAHPDFNNISINIYKQEKTVNIYAIIQCIHKPPIEIIIGVSNILHSMSDSNKVNTAS